MKGTMESAKETRARISYRGSKVSSSCVLLRYDQPIENGIGVKRLLESPGCENAYQPRKGATGRSMRRCSADSRRKRACASHNSSSDAIVSAVVSGCEK